MHFDFAGRIVGTIPVRGRKLRFRHRDFFLCRTIPVRGRQRLLLFLSCVALGTIPVRGAKACPSLGDFPRSRCNLSPQGDGNFAIALHLSTQTFIATYPRKGTITSFSTWNNYRNNIAAYPRKGTETIKPLEAPQCCWISTYPREGTETFGGLCWF